MARVPEHGHARRHVSDADAVVHDLSTFALGVPRIDIRSTDLELESARYPVPHHERVRLLFLAVLVQVDEAGHHHEAARIDRAVPVNVPVVDENDAPATDRDSANGIQPRLGVDDPTVGDHEIVGGVG